VIAVRAALACAGVFAFVACRAPAGGFETPRPERAARLAAGLTMTPALVLLELAPDAQFRWAAPESLVNGLTSEDIASVNSTEVLDLRESVRTVVLASGWRLVPDSAQYEIAVFTVARTGMRREGRTESFQNPDSNLPLCDTSRGSNQPRCRNGPAQTTRTVYVSVPYTERHVFHVVRRVSDGATRVWTHPVIDLRAVDAGVARDLLRLFASGDPD